MLKVPAFVLKNYVPDKQKVVILHKTLGKVTCVYHKRDQAARLCTGSLLFCSVTKKGLWYELDHLDIYMIPSDCSVQDITFFHQIVLLCLKILPSEIMVGELFDFLWYVFQNLKNLTDDGRQIVLMRLFLMFDLLPEHPLVHQHALQDPYGNITTLTQDIEKIITDCWKRFEQELES